MKRILLSLLVVSLMAVGAMPLAAVGAQNEYIETIYLSNTLGDTDGETQIYTVSLDDATPKADLVPLPDVGYGDGIVPFNHVDVMACTPDGTKLYCMDDRNSSPGLPRYLGVYDLTAPSWTNLGQVTMADGTTNFGICDQAAFSSDGTLYVTRNEDDKLYWIDIDPISASFLRAIEVGVIKNGSATVDVNGADIVFDENDDCYLWTLNARTGAPAGLYKFAQPLAPGDIAASFLGTGSVSFTGLAIRGGGAVAEPLLGSRTDTNAISIIDETNGNLETQYPMYLGGSLYDGYIFGDMTVGELAVPVEEFYSICGYKFADWNDEQVPLPGWTIYLEMYDGEGVWDQVAFTVTDENGRYCFAGLPAGDYRVSENIKAGWDQVSPMGGYHYFSLPGGETYGEEGIILYGAQRNNNSNNGLYEIDLNTGTSTRLLNAGGSGNSPNALGYDPVNERLYYMNVLEPNGPSALYFYDIQADVSYSAGLSYPNDVIVGASFYDGAYYYIPNSTADLHKVTLNPDGTASADILLWPDFNGAGNASVYRFGDFAINRSGILYASTNGTSGSTEEFFKVDVATGEYTNISYVNTLGLQVSFGSDGTLYAHSAGTGEVFTVDLLDGSQTSIGYVESDLRSQELFSDLASGTQPQFYNFYNTPHLYCFDETAWAADGEAGTNRFVEPPGNWATYIDYTEGNGAEQSPAEYPLYAGQTNYAGKLLVWDDGDNIYVKYVASNEDGYAPEGYCGGSWTGLTEYHLQVVDEYDDFYDYRTYNKKKDEYGAPIPGQFDETWEGSKTSEVDWIVVDISAFEDTDILIAAHAVMWWCGYDCDVLAEIFALE